MSAYAATYYVSPRSSLDKLSLSQAKPGTFQCAIANAPDGSKVNLEDGNYNGAPTGYVVETSGVAYEAQHLRAARITNSKSANLLWADKGAINDICRGIVFGPCVTPKGDDWSGGGGDGWKFFDCEFVKNDGMGFGSNSLVEHCLFTDQWMNSFDVNNCHGFVMRNCIARRGNRANADNDATGDKVDIAFDTIFDGLIAYDNVGSALWFDTNNKNWKVVNCTFFANHGSKDWFNFHVTAAVSASQLAGIGQDGEGLSVGERVMDVSGTAANIGYKGTVSAVSGYNPQTLTLSPPLPAAAQPGDDFAVQHSDSGHSMAVMSEANPNGFFLNNVTYNNTGAGFFDADSGNGHGVAAPGVTITGNRFFYDGIAFRSITGGSGDPTRELGPATVEHNTFKIGALTGRNAFHPGSGNYLQGYPGPHYAIDFDYNTYSADRGYTGSWADWYYFAGGPRTDFHAYSLQDLQSAATFDQDKHSRPADLPFRGRLVQAYDWPDKADASWSDVYHPNNNYAPQASIHQVNEDETPYIENVLLHGHPGQRATVTVFGHTPFMGSAPFTCEVYDYSGRWLTLKMASKSARDALERLVPPYAVLNGSRIAVTLVSVDQYEPEARFGGG